MSDFNKCRHDFINNALRVEVLNKLITESLEKEENPEVEYLLDLKKFLSQHQELLIELSTHFNSTAD